MNAKELPPLLERDFRIFLAGFACSREGFNGECPIAALAASPAEATEALASIAARDDVVDELRQLYPAVVGDSHA